MRVLIIILLILQVTLASGQPDIRRSVLFQEAVNEALITNPQFQYEPQRKKAITELKSNWYTWLYKINKLEVIQEYYDWMNDIARVADLKYEDGEIDLYENSTLHLKLAEIETSYAVTSNDIEIAQNLVRQFLFTNDQIAPADSILRLYEIDKGNQPMDILEESTDSAGMINEYEKLVHNTTVENKQLQLDNLFLNLQFYGTYKLKNADILLHTAHARFKTDEIDYIEFIGYISGIYAIKQEYLDLLNDYNQCAIQLEYYAY
jgi:hypothetical protein